MYINISIQTNNLITSEFLPSKKIPSPFFQFHQLVISDLNLRQNRLEIFGLCLASVWKKTVMVIWWSEVDFCCPSNWKNIFKNQKHISKWRWNPISSMGRFVHLPIIYPKNQAFMIGKYTIPMPWMVWNLICGPCGDQDPPKRSKTQREKKGHENRIWFNYCIHAWWAACKFRFKDPSIFFENQWHPRNLYKSVAPQ